MLLFSTLLKKHSENFWSSLGIGQYILWRLSNWRFFCPEGHFDDNKCSKLSRIHNWVWAKFFREDNQNCILRIQSNILETSFFWEKASYCRKLFLRLTNLQEVFDKKKFTRKIYRQWDDSLKKCWMPMNTTFGMSRGSYWQKKNSKCVKFQKKFGPWAERIRKCQKWILSVQKKVFGEKKFVRVFSDFR